MRKPKKQVAATACIHTCVAHCHAQPVASPAAAAPLPPKQHGTSIHSTRLPRAACQLIYFLFFLHTKTGSRVVVEEFLDGEEASFFALVDGDSAVALASAQDHKAVGDGDTGPNTGGMGAYSPAPVVTPEIEAQVRGWL
jgi:hypothetical protein